jgi:segregation and condensation protein B
LDPTDIKKAIECIIFISDQPLSVDKLQQVFTEVERGDIRMYLKELALEWAGLGRGIALEEVAGGYQFRTDPAYREHLTIFTKRVKKFHLSRAALEVLAIIAYKQPATRVEVESIRGVDSSGVINALLERRILEIKGSKEVIGRPFLYGTTPEFLEVFGLKSLSDLPTLKEIDEISKNLDPGISNLPPEELS